MPRSHVDSIEKLLWREDVSAHVAGIDTVRQSRLVSLPFPPSFPPFFRREHTFPTRRAFHLKQVTVSPFSGLTWIASGVLSQSVGSLERVMGWGMALDDMLLPTKELADEREVLVCPDTGFYHWLLENLPNICWALATYPDLVLLLPSNAPPYMLETTRMLLRELYSEERVVHVSSPVRAKRALVPEIYADGGYVHPADIAILREKLMPKRRQPTTSKTDTHGRLYISRTKSPKRRLVGEEALERALLLKGFTIIASETLPFADQLGLFSAADLIVGPHGAGLANLVWADPGTNVVELFPATYFNDCYASLSMMAGLSYGYVICRATEPHIDQTVVDKVLRLVEGL
jgi:hypothetical protein